METYGPNLSRRDLMKVMVTAAASGALGVLGARPAHATDTRKLKITLAGYQYDRVDALVDLLMNYDEYTKNRSLIAPLVKPAAPAGAATTAGP